MKKILFSIPFGMSARNFMRSDVYRVLREKVSLVVVSPLSKDPVFCDEFRHANVEFVDIPRNRNRVLHACMQLLFSIETTRFTAHHPEVSTLVTLKNQLRKEHPLRYFVYRGLACTLGIIPGFIPLLRLLYYRLSKNSQVEKLFDRHNFDLIFLTHGYVQEEIELALAARRRMIRVVNMIHSWDNVTSKSAMRQMTSPEVGRLWERRLIDDVLVWNRILAEEIQSLYGVPSERIFIAGIPQFDSYLDKARIRPRDEFFKSIGGDPSKALILYMAAAPSLFHDQTVVIRDLASAIKSARFSRPAQLLVRFHPRTDMAAWVHLFDGEGVLFHKPSAAFSALPVERGWSKDDGESSELIDQLYYSDVVLNGFSTTSIDAAAFDKPIVCYGYDGDANNSDQIEYLYKGITHYEKLMALGGIRVGRNAQELIKIVDSYLKNPTLDADGRARIREQECFQIDGKSGQRIANFIVSLLP